MGRNGRRKAWVMGLGLLLCAAIAPGLDAAGGSQAEDSRVWWTRDSRDPDWVRGRVVLRGSAAELWGRIEAVETWALIFSDITRLSLVERNPPHWRVRVQTLSFDCGEHEYHLVFGEPNTVEMRISAPGVESVGYLSVSDDPGGGILVTYRLLVRSQGFAGWFVSRKELRRKQEDMVIRYLRDVRRLSEATLAANGSPPES